MNPDLTSEPYQRAVGVHRLAALADAQRRAELHERAVARRRKAKRGGRR